MVQKKSRLRVRSTLPLELWELWVVTIGTDTTTRSRLIELRIRQMCANRRSFPRTLYADEIAVHQSHIERSLSPATCWTPGQTTGTLTAIYPCPLNGVAHHCSIAQASFAYHCSNGYKMRQSTESESWPKHSLLLSSRSLATYRNPENIGTPKTWRSKIYEYTASHCVGDHRTLQHLRTRTFRTPPAPNQECAILKPLASSHHDPHSTPGDNRQPT
ncbi:hypothetical protein BDV95DRAFT_187539 [Massariosphaeria phaeospora]|uniref:Uncharacterized protein n=1 Tax=Massariosphaeria phaeospora TaxID=100035 RepID=A0A7C8I0C0_9PLEO|nr:hypothetical protein BDV95DRAFT_187539 [Massariosphaeria phaeospora]